MKVYGCGKAATIESIPAGSCFAFRRRGITYIAIKLASMVTNEEVVTVLSPHHPNNTSMSTGLLATSAFGHEPVWILPDAIAAPKANTDTMRSSTESKQENGSLALGAESAFVTTHINGDTAWIDLSTGDLIRTVPRPAVWFEQWDIWVPRLEGEGHELLCSVPGKPPLATAAI